MATKPIKWHPADGTVTVRLPDGQERELHHLVVARAVSGAAMLGGFDEKNRRNIVALGWVIDEAERERLERALEEAEGQGSEKTASPSKE